jgi:hypothetical protein
LHSARHTRGFGGQHPTVLPVAFFNSEITSAVGGIAAAMAIGAFLCQSKPSSISGSEEERRRDTALGGLIGMAAMIGLILLSEIHW